ncbi:MAG: EmrA/EmrK family multidrug efflux transporter periplasmic adaptor subunit [Geothermobacteraceae bacterium]
MSDEKKTPRKPLNKRRLASILLLVMIVALAIGLARFVRHRLDYAVTNAVFVASDSLTEVAFDRVSGQIAELLVSEGDHVAAGQPLAQLDNSRYRLERDKAAASLQKAKETLEALKLTRKRLAEELPLATAAAQRDVVRLQRETEAARAGRTAIESRLKQARRDLQRFRNLFEQKVVPRQRLEQLEVEVDSLQGQLEAQNQKIAALEAARDAARVQKRLAASREDQLLELDRKIAAADSEVARLSAQLAKAEKDLASTRLVSPVSGRIAKRFVGPGASVSPGRPVYAVVDPGNLYIIALLEENKLEGIRPGSEAVIRIDAFSDRTWRGEVEQVLPASAATFALAPRDISAGEFTKVAQRIPVRIRITDGDTSLLRVGLGGEVDIRRQN